MTGSGLSRRSLPRPHIPGAHPAVPLGVPWQICLFR
jgi:hypothetical protein